MISYVEQIREKRLKAEQAESAGRYAEASAIYQELVALYYKWSFGAPLEIEKERKAEAKQLELRARNLAKLPAQRPTDEPAQRGNGPSISFPKKEFKLREDEKEFFPIIESFIMATSITWNDIGGLDAEVEAILTALCLSFSRHPANVNLKRSKNILLYGPPGTGKTLIASAACSSMYEASPSSPNASQVHQAAPSFFCVDIANLISKYVGDSSKKINTLFEVAKQLAPSVVFLDEFESISQRRTGEDSAHELRVKAQILTQLDGFSSKDNTDAVLVIAATNRPWDIDSAVLSRFGSKFYIPLPDAKGRERILGIHAKNTGIPIDCSLSTLASDKLTKHFSGRDLSNLFTAAVEHMISSTNRAPSPSDIAKLGMGAMRSHELKVRPLTWKDFELALTTIRPQTSDEEVEQYLRWSKDPSYCP